MNETERLEPLGENALKVRRWRVAIGTLASLVVTVGGVLFVTTIGDPPAWLWAVPARGGGRRLVVVGRWTTPAGAGG